MSTTSTDTPKDADADAPLAPPSRRRVAVVVVLGLFAVTAAIVGSSMASRLVHGALGGQARTATAFVIEVVLLGAIVRFARLDGRAIGLGLERRDAKRLATGALLGVLAVVATLAVAALAGGVHVAIAPRAHWPLASSFAAQLAGTALGASFEEVAFRAGLVGVLALAFRREIAVGVPAVLFGLAHAGNHGASAVSVANTAIAALVLEGLFLLPTRNGDAPSLAASTGFHLTWNFLLAAVLGLAVSGGATSARFVDVTMPSGAWSGGAYGIEASPATTVTYGLGAAVLLATVLGIFPVSRKRASRNLRGPDAAPE